MRDSGFRIHPQLLADCHQLGRLPCAHLLLHRNASLHWFILVPEAACLDLTDLPAATRGALLDDDTLVAAVLKGDLAYPRVNIGALGLLVPQLHLHVIGRREQDPCWPAPVWGNLPPGPGYSDGQLARLRRALKLEVPG
jgi:diadenosine tetraphosphate (Ap4A) HIT family hydrolase